MCFNGYMSGTFAVIGLALSFWINYASSNRKLAVGVFFYFTMEMLQAVQYLYIASDLGTPICDSFVNKFLTIIGLLHISLQPYFAYMLNEAICDVPSKDKSKEENERLTSVLHQYKTVKRLCLIGGFIFFMRWPLSYVPGWNTLNGAVSTEWLRGDEICTFKRSSMVHLGWSVPLADPSYNIPAIGIHAFLMFAPAVALWESNLLVLEFAFLYVTGPLLASFISPNSMEQASIWCFFSIAQIGFLIATVYKEIPIRWPKKVGGGGKTQKKISP